MSSSVGVNDISDQDVSIIDGSSDRSLMNFPPEILLHIRAHLLYLFEPNSMFFSRQYLFWTCLI